MLSRYKSDKNGRPVKTAVIYTENEHCLKKTDIDPGALWIIRRLKECGFEALIVGGAVRDLLLHKTPKDFDLVTDATPARIKRIFRNSYIIGKRFRIVHIFFDHRIFEVTTFRSFAEGKTVGNTFGTIEEDSKRRDFTLNALYYDPEKNQIIDYVGGFKDIQTKKIVPVIPLKQIFVEDPVRMLRAVKYAASSGFKIPFLLRRKITSSAHLLSPVSPSRLTEELLKIINSGQAYEIVSSAIPLRLFMYLQPAASALLAEKEGFCASYMESLKELDELHHRDPAARLGDKLVYLIRDFIKLLANWELEAAAKTSAAELYKFAWKECRSFVLPMNPQRSELEYAVRFCLKEFGISVRPPKKKKSPQQRTAAV